MPAPLPPALSANLLAATATVPAIKLHRRPDTVFRPREPSDAPLPQQTAKRSKIWELSDTLHCSIIGTCLSNAELRHVLVRAAVIGAETVDEHELHVLGVMLAGRREAGAKLLQRALDRCHGLTIKRLARAKDETALGGLWDEAVQEGDIPGAYWALLSHPAATEALVKKAFRAVHMLSHLVGAVNRADIRRLRQQEEEIAALTEKLARQQRQLREGFTSRDQTIHRLNDMLIRRIEPVSAGSESAALRELLAEAGRKLEQETARRERLEQRVQTMSVALQKVEAALRRSESEREALARDLTLVEDQVAGLLQPQTDDAPLDLSGQTLLYVGGRANQIPQLKALVERTGARLLHHDGGIEHSSALLPGLISRADCLFFPVDCISHDAVATIKRLCRQLEKPYHPLRTASLATLIASLALASQKHDAAIAAP